MSSRVRQGLKSALRLFSLRNFVVVPAGALLGLLPLPSDPSSGSPAVLMPYVPSYAHHAYGFHLASTRLHTNAAARAWLAAADRALLVPEPAALPLVVGGELADVEAAGYEVSLPAGRRLRIDAAFPSEQATSRDWFVDLFRIVDGRRERIAGTVPGAPAAPFEVDAVDGGQYVVRVQPAIGGGGAFSLGISASPLLAFPVQGVDGRAIWSGFGAERDGGRRAHRGVDIFAVRGTPVLAAMDGWVTRVETTRVGGNVVWMQPLFGNMRLYYAHLHEQWVEIGDFVRAGEPVGSVGNTGNAVTTPPHLHFGVYVRQPGVRGGARDPAGFLR